MKKSLIALAVLAAAGTSFAQVTISGKLGFSYQKNAVPQTGAANHGMQMADGDVSVSATEDLGGGVSVTAKSEMKLRGRDTAIDGRDAYIAVVTPVGLFTMAAAESPNVIYNVAGAPVTLSSGHDNSVTGGTILDAGVNADILGYKVPVGPVTLGLTYADSIGAAGAGAGNVTGTGLTLAYAGGPLAAYVDHTVFASPVSVVNDGLTRTRAWVTYDFGVAKIGAGHQVKNHDYASQSSLSVNVPLGAVSVGLMYSARASQPVSATYGLTASDSRSGTALGAQYDFSKLTNINFSYSTYSTTGNMLDNEYRLRLTKKF